MYFNYIKDGKIKEKNQVMVQDALDLYSQLLIDKGRVSTVDSSTGKPSYDIEHYVFSLATVLYVKETGHLLGLDSQGELSEQSKSSIEEYVRVVLEDLGKTPDERLESFSGFSFLEPFSFDEYNSRLDSISEYYNLYLDSCAKTDTTPRGIYTFGSNSKPRT